MNATTTVERPRTLAQAQDRIDELLAAGDPLQLKAQLAAKDAEIKLLKAAGSKQQSAASAAPVNSPPPAAKPIDQMSSAELIAACDSAAAAGNHVESNRFFRQYETIKQAGR
jgi:hypothetical protein